MLTHVLGHIGAAGNANRNLKTLVSNGVLSMDCVFS